MTRRAVLLCLGLFAAVLPAAATSLTVAWRDKPPYHYIENGVEQGFLLQRAHQVFELAGIPARFVEEPAKRIWANLAAGVPSYCSIGWYKLPEREAIAQFSDIFHTDPPHTLLVAPAAVERVRAHRTLAALLADPQLTLGLVDGTSYGPELDALIKKAGNKLERKVVSPALMTRSVAANRISFMFIDRDDWEYLRTREEDMRKTAQLDLPDMPRGLNRYVVCSKDVPHETMARINKAIDTLRNAGKPPAKTPGK